MIEDTMEDILEAASVERVFGPPVKNNGTVIIPVASITSGLGFGGGFGTAMKNMKMRRGLAQKAEAGKTRRGTGDAEEGAGGGGGGRVSAWPVAVVVATNAGVEVQPVIDRTKITMTALIAGAISFLMLVPDHEARLNGYGPASRGGVSNRKL